MPTGLEAVKTPTPGQTNRSYAPKAANGAARADASVATSAALRPARTTFQQQADQLEAEIKLGFRLAYAEKTTVMLVQNVRIRNRIIPQLEEAAKPIALGFPVVAVALSKLAKSVYSTHIFVVSR